MPRFKSRFESLVVRRGHKRSIIAIAYKLLRTVFHMIQRQQPYQETSVDYQALSVKHNAPRWIKCSNNTAISSRQLEL